MSFNFCASRVSLRLTICFLIKSASHLKRIERESYGSHESSLTAYLCILEIDPHICSYCRSDVMNIKSEEKKNYIVNKCDHILETSLMLCEMLVRWFNVV